MLKFTISNKLKVFGTMVDYQRSLMINDNTTKWSEGYIFHIPAAFRH